MDPEEHIDELLAAPDSLRKNEAELRKYRDRKALEAAERERNRNRKRKEPPTIEDLLEDLRRVASDEATNPWHQFRSISRRRYELYGNFPVEAIDHEFGQFSHALEVAGLRDQPGDRMWRKKRAAESRRQHAERYLERFVAPYVTRPGDARFADDGSYTIVSISDTHSQFLDPFVWFTFLSALRDLAPDCALFNGDTLEGAEISSHIQIVGWTEPLQSEFDFHREMARQVREDAGFRGDFLCTGGNHGVDRLAMYMTQSAKALVSLRDMRIDRQLGLGDYDVQLFQGGTIMSPQGEENAKRGLLLFDFYRIHHGTLAGKHPSSGELVAAGRSGQSGHVHRAGLAFGTSEANEALSWMCTPCGCRHEAARAYLKGTTTGWQRGIGFARLFADGSVHQYPCVVTVGRDGRERLTVEGITYTRPDDMEDPPAHGQWLSEMRLGA